jgi:hypothetical protein
LAVDAQGNVWVSNYDTQTSFFNSAGTLTELAPNGSLLSPIDYDLGTTAGIQAFGVAVDGNDNVWASHFTTSTYSLSILNQAGNFIDGTPETNGAGGLFQPLYLAVSPLSYPNGDVWVVDNGGKSTNSPSSMSRFSYNGDPFGNGYGLSIPNQNSEDVAIDAAGFVWITNPGVNSIIQLAPDGSLVNSATIGGLNQPFCIAVDPNGNLWITNAANSDGTSSLTKYNVSSDVILSANNYTGGGLSQAEGVAVDAAGNVWVANFTGSSISEFNSAGTALTPAGSKGGYQLAVPSQPDSVAVDASGNVWTANFAPGAPPVTVYYGLAAPTTSPIVAAIANGFTPVNVVSTPP